MVVGKGGATIESLEGSVMAVPCRDATAWTAAISDLSITRQILERWSEDLSTLILQAVGQHRDLCRLDTAKHFDPC